MSAYTAVAVQKKLTLTVDEEVYQALYRVIGRHVPLASAVVAGMSAGETPALPGGRPLSRASAHFRPWPFS